MTATCSWLSRGPDHHQWVGTTVAYRERRDRGRAIRRCGFGVVVFVAGGALVASWLLPPARTADNAARAFVEARVEGDQATAWNLVCRPVRTLYGDYDAFAEQAERAFTLPDVDVSTETVRAARLPEGPAAVVAVSVTRSDVGWFDDYEVTDGEVIVIVEDGNFRICGTEDPNYPT